MNPYGVDMYKSQTVSTMTQGEMLLKLYDEAIKQIGLARAAIVGGDLVAMDKSLKKTQDIVNYLRSTLNFKYPVSFNLRKLYDFFNNQLVMANVKKDVKPLDDIVPLIADLRDTFDECDKIDRSQRVRPAGIGAV